MTRKEAIRRVEFCRNFLADNYSDMGELNFMALNMAIKALEQENVLNEMFENIKTEIDFIPTYGAKFADGSIDVHVNKKDVLQIIDKYKSESEVNNG